MFLSLSFILIQSSMYFCIKNNITEVLMYKTSKLNHFQISNENENDSIESKVT